MARARWFGPTRALVTQPKEAEAGKKRHGFTPEVAEVWLHVYDIIGSNRMGFNRLFKDGIGLGGFFHGAIEVYDNVEWSFGYSERGGTGIFSCISKTNCTFGYTYRESVLLGTTELSRHGVQRVLSSLREDEEWSTDSYSLLSKNCCHFCFKLAKKLGVSEPPAWLNRFANTAATINNGIMQVIQRIQRTFPCFWPS